MKILNITETFFKLPDDFKGTASDALRLMAMYLETPTKPMGSGSEDQAFKDFLEVIEKGGHLMTKMSVQQLKDNKWENLPLDIKFK